MTNRYQSFNNLLTSIRNSIAVRRRSNWDPITRQNLNRLANNVLSFLNPRQYRRQVNFGSIRTGSMRSVQLNNPYRRERNQLRSQNTRRLNELIALFRNLGANDNFIKNFRRRILRKTRTPSPPRITGSKRRSPPSPSGGSSKQLVKHTNGGGRSRARSLAASR
jgi:hypothetical protein